MEYTAAHLAQCEGNLAVCHTVPVIRRRPHNTCTSGIFFENSSDFMKQCKPKVFPHREIPDRIVSRDPHNFLVTTSASHYRMSCRNMGLSLYPCTSYMSIKVPCGCTMYVGPLHVTPSVTDCSDNSAEVELSYPINYAIYLSFEYSPREYPSVKISHKPIQLDVPDVSAYVRNFSDISDHMAHNGLELNTVTQAVQQTRTTYQRQRQDFQSKYDMISFNDAPEFDDIFTLIVILAITGFIITNSWLIWKYMQVSKLAAKLLVFYNMQSKVDAQFVTPGSKSDTPYTKLTVPRPETPIIGLIETQFMLKVIFAIIMAYAIKVIMSKLII
jgi:hypothetical protein